VGAVLSSTNAYLPKFCRASDILSNYTYLMPMELNMHSKEDVAQDLISDGDAALFSRTMNDNVLIRAAADLTRELSTANPAIFWGDFLASIILGYAAVYIATSAPIGWAIAAAVVAVLALYRAVSFIHEITHLKTAAVPGFRAGWNLLLGIPLLVPSFMYEGTHNQHHARTRYGTVDDPEYLPLALMRPWQLAVFLFASLLAPIALLLRFGVLAPLSALIPPLRREVIARASTLATNPAYRRRPPEGQFRRDWLIMESAAAVWAIALISMVATGIIPLRAFAIFIAIVSVATLLNQTRTLVAHLWENDGEPMSVTAQYLDSVNVPPPGFLPALWAPVGLRYHALHHLIPSVPYHALGEAHRRLAKQLPMGTTYHKANYTGLNGLMVRLFKSAGTKRV
jgi:fatty acid desaturase